MTPLRHLGLKYDDVVTTDRIEYTAAMLGKYAWVATASVLLGCGGAGVLEYASGVPTAFRAQFSAEGCSLKSHLKVAAEQTKFYLIDGREAYAWLAVDSKYRGSEVENYYQDEHGHHFSFRERRRAWQYHIPDEVGANGVMEYFERDNLRVVKIRDGFAVQGSPTEQCALVYVGNDDSTPSSDAKPTPPCPTAAAAPSSSVSEPSPNSPDAEPVSPPSDPSAEAAP